MREEFFQGIVDRMVNHRTVFGAILRVGTLDGLHVMNGVDRTREITVTHLISNTSGLPDYFSGKNRDGRSAAEELLAGNDEPWPLERILAAVRTMRPRFRPGQKGRALYSDTNYELLGAIIEEITGKPIGEVFQEYIFDGLELRDTYAFRDVNDSSPAPMYYRRNKVRLPRYLASVTAEGGIISTARETMQFLKAFFSGRFFAREGLEALKRWNLVFSPGVFHYGIGLERQVIPRILTPRRPIGELLGFWGQSGAFAFHNPATDLYFTGTVNQLSGYGHNRAVRAMLRVIRAAGR